MFFITLYVKVFQTDDTVAFSSGQQISWLAARSITYKFIRLFNPSLPETRPDNAEYVLLTLSIELDLILKLS
jgi:hypothetical protein